MNTDKISESVFIRVHLWLNILAQPDLVWLTFRESARSTLGIRSVRGAFPECMCDPMKSQRTNIFSAIEISLRPLGILHEPQS